MSIDWTTLTPKCRTCDTPSGQLDRDDRCPNCRAVTIADVIEAAADIAGMPPAPVKRNQSRAGGKRVPGESMFNIAEMERLYRDGATCQEIADQLGCTAPTVSTHLRRLGHPSRRGRRKQEVCGKGLHPMTDDNTRTLKNGGRMCKACQKVRAAEAWQRQKALLHAAKAAGLDINPDPNPSRNAA